jgi:hypothetical protein
MEDLKKPKENEIKEADFEHELKIQNDGKVFMCCHEIYEGGDFEHGIESAITEYIAKQKFKI